MDIPSIFLFTFMLYFVFFFFSVGYNHTIISACLFSFLFYINLPFTTFKASLSYGCYLNNLFTSSETCFSFFAERLMYLCKQTIHHNCVPLPFSHSFIFPHTHANYERHHTPLPHSFASLIHLLMFCTMK